MNATFLLKNLLVAVAAVPLLLAGHRADPAYQTANKRISADYRTDKAACLAAPAQATRLCLVQARTRKQVAHTELESGAESERAGDQARVREARTHNINSKRDAILPPIALPFKARARH